MAAVDDPKTLGRTRLSFANEAEIDEFAATLDKFERGELTPDQWRAYRLVRGNYGQRQDVVQMIRVKIPQGDPGRAQLTALADSADTWSRGFGHITTRQNVQFHFVQPHDVEKVMRRVAEAGLTSPRGLRQRRPQHHGLPVRRRGRGRGLRRHALRGGDDALPAAPSPELLAPAQVQDRLRGLRLRGPRPHRHQRPRLPRAHPRTASAGFRLVAGGGTSTVATSARVLYDFLPAGEIFEVAEAVLRVFHRLGDFKHKQRNRMKFLIRELGWDALARRVREGAAGLPRRGRRAVLVPSGSPAGGIRARLAAAGRRPPSRNARRAPRAAEVRGPGIVPETPRPVRARRALRPAVGEHERAAAAPGRVLAGRR